MNASERLTQHKHIQAGELLARYAAGTLEPDERQQVNQHLAQCGECQEDLRLWQAVAGEIQTAARQLAPRGDLASRALQRVQTAAPHLSPSYRARAAGRAPRHPGRIFQRFGQILLAQAPLVRGEIWPASAVIVAMGYAAAVLFDVPQVLRALAPLAAAGSLAVIYGPDNDASLELALSTPTSPRQILLARMALVFGYNLALALLASLALLPLVPGLGLGQLILSWLAPMAFLSMAALALSLRMGADNAIALTYLAWLGHFLISPSFDQPNVTYLPVLQPVLDAYYRFWQMPAILLLLSAVLAGAMLWQVGREHIYHFNAESR